MRLDNVPESNNVEDQRGQGGAGFGFPSDPFGSGSGRQVNVPMGSRGGGMSLGTLVILVILYFVLKFIGVDIMGFGNQGSTYNAGRDDQISLPDSGDLNYREAGPNLDSQAKPGTGSSSSATAPEDAQVGFVRRVLGSTEQVWDANFKQMGSTYEKPKLVLFSHYVQSACGMAQSASGPFYCPGDQKVYLDLSFFRELQQKFSAPGEAAQAYVVAHEIGHHVQDLLGITEKVEIAKRTESDQGADGLSVRLELQADCLAGIWAQESKTFENGDAEAALNAASQIGDDTLQKRSQGYAVPDSFTHGTSAQRVHWFQTGLNAKSLESCNTFNIEKP